MFTHCKRHRRRGSEAVTPPDLKFIQIAVAADGNALFALADDGTVYQYDGSTKRWVAFPKAAA
jgi:hypothetical protein